MIPILTIVVSIPKISKKCLNKWQKYRKIINRFKNSQYGYRLKALGELITNMYILWVFGWNLQHLGLNMSFFKRKKVKKLINRNLKLHLSWAYFYGCCVISNTQKLIECIDKRLIVRITQFLNFRVVLFHFFFEFFHEFILLIVLIDVSKQSNSLS